ncbi:ComF family protein [Riemerella columbina]|uniref:ComF family protein n=1 Tax=Riemerella columbina TaxID=103810 RepID=UPI00035FA345|nr:ComF family protein [Riemerella columbina]
MFTELLFPNRCIGCSNVIEPQGVVCWACYQDLPFTHFSFDKDNDFYKKCQLNFPLEEAFALMHYDEGNLAQQLIHQLKYKGMQRVGEYLAHEVAERMPKPFVDVLVTVPLHPKKLKERGYNQLHLLANTLSKIWNIPHDSDILKRNFYSKPQAQKDKTHRTYTKDLFSLNKVITHQHMLLIDDVYTTGNTMNKAAWQILKQHENKISVLVLAID